MAVPYQACWQTAAYADPLTHRHRVFKASDWWANPGLAAAAIVPAGIVRAGVTPLAATGSHALGRVPGASMPDRVNAWRAMNRAMELHPSTIDRRMVRIRMMARSCRFLIWRIQVTVRVPKLAAPIGVVAVNLDEITHCFNLPCRCTRWCCS